MCMVLDPRLLNYGIASSFPVELPLVLPVGICGRSPGCHTEQLGSRESEAGQACLPLLCLPPPAIPAILAHTC